MDGDKVDQWSLIRDFLSGKEFPPGLSIKIRRKIKRQARSFAINQASKLMYIGKGGCKAESEREVVVDPEERSRVLLRLHDENGHFGRNKTRSIISKHFYWPGMIEDIDQYVQFCKVCQRTGLGRNLKHRPPLHPIPVKGVWNQVGIDLVGPLQETPRGNRYLITMTDYFSKWSEAAPIKNKHADTVVAFIYSVFQRLGIPNHIITDQGREFNNELMTSLCAMTKCTHKITSAYHPQSNGVVKRFNQTIISGLQKVTNEHSDDWDTKIDDFLFAYRITIQDSTKHSPFEVMFNRQPNLPLDIGMSSSDADAEPNPASPNPASVSADSVEEIFSKMQNISKVVQGNVRQNIQAAQSRQKKHYDKQHVSQIDWNK